MYQYLGLQDNKNEKASANVVNPYLVSKSKAEMHLVSLIENLATDPILNNANERPLRCTGTALCVAIYTLICTMPTTGCRIMLFTCGPTTYGPGKVIDQSLKQQMRTHFEINKDETPYMHNATKFYSALGDLVKANGYALDLFSCSLNQTGVLEMIDLPRFTGGCIVMSETFSHPTFANSLKKLFELDASGYFKSHFYNCMQIQTSAELVVSGTLGLLFPTKNSRSASAVSENPIGIGRSTDYFAGVIEPTTTFAIFFEVKINDNQIIPEDKLGLIQITTIYSHANGRRIRRTTTIARKWLHKGFDKNELLAGFDQEAATAVMARLILHRQIKEDFNILKFVDNHLLQFCRRYAPYTVGNEDSLHFPDAMALYPNFFYYFRRSIFAHNFGCSPDESAMFRYYLYRENVINILLMIQPALDQYLINSEEPSPVFLSSLSLKEDCVLLLDSFFTVIVWHGKSIVQWKNAGFHELEEYQNLRDLLEAPRVDSQAICSQRFPCPLLIECNAKTGPARYLEAVVDPAREGLINSEDSSLENYLTQLKRMIVKI
jgi:protein transport protein SEC23